MRNYIFDFDGTIADSGQVAIQATQQAFAQHFLPVPAAELVQGYIGLPIEVFFKDLLPDQSQNEAEFNSLLESFRRIYQDLSGQLKLFPGMAEVLATLASEGKQLFIDTSKSSAGIERDLQSLEISHYFTGVLGSDDVAAYKPAPAGIHQLMATYDLNPAETVMIGDTKYDIAMGKAAGVRTCGVTWGEQDRQLVASAGPDYLIDQRQDLLTL
ncbi:HAD family hydrolase [Weissella halotolerans]|uniref:Phosphatase n=1 Tax=Weissella halotolerans DSM 20190 TaxID=1123500 RepID=A0A0R2FQN7_9LACO|nr:HAD family hydrolase [Weissella halotolerans]KRN30819.1 phosphatase [Weissella halotolerans DSM 20190]